MSMSLDEIQQAIAALQSSDRYHLWCWLDEEFGDHEAEASVEAAWDTEMASRLEDVVEGQVKLIPWVEVDKELQALFDQRGIERTSKQSHLGLKIAIGMNQADAGDFTNFTAEEIMDGPRTLRGLPPLDNAPDMR
jgi:hypothetical protein